MRPFCWPFRAGRASHPLGPGLSSRLVGGSGAALHHPTLHLQKEGGKEDGLKRQHMHIERGHGISSWDGDHNHDPHCFKRVKCPPCFLLAAAQQTAPGPEGLPAHQRKRLGLQRGLQRNPGDAVVERRNAPLVCERTGGGGGECDARSA